MDSLILAPFLGTLFLSITASQLGVLVYLKKEALLSETLSHAAFLGLVIGLVFSHIVKIDLCIACAFVTSVLALKMLSYLGKIYTKDSALCFVLALFFSIAMILSSLLQKNYPVMIRGANAYLYGSASTICKDDVYIYALFTMITLIFIAFAFRYLKISYFDEHYAKNIGRGSRHLSLIGNALFLLSIVTAIKSVGVVLITAMLITPAIFARLWTKTLSQMFVIAFLGASTSAVLGLFLSIKMKVSSGPCIVLTSSILTFISLIFSPNGLLHRWIQRVGFKILIAEENLLKSLLKKEGSMDKSFLPNYRIPLMLMAKGDVVWGNGKIFLTEKGEKRGKIVLRRHRLWEAYLCFKLNSPVNKVHASAERVEHILHETIEKQIDKELNFPKTDPHNQEIFQRSNL